MQRNKAYYDALVWGIKHVDRQVCQLALGSLQVWTFVPAAVEGQEMAGRDAFNSVPCDVEMLWAASVAFSQRSRSTQPVNV